MVFHVLKSLLITLFLVMCAFTATAQEGHLHITSDADKIGKHAETIKHKNAIAIGFKTSKEFDYFEFDIAGRCISCEGMIYFMQDFLSADTNVPTLHDVKKLNYNTAEEPIKFKESWLGPYDAGTYYVLIVIDKGGIVIPSGNGEPAKENNIELHSEWILTSPYEPVWMGRRELKRDAGWHFGVRGY